MIRVEQESGTVVFKTPSGFKRARYVNGRWIAEYRTFLLWFIPIGWDFYGFEFGDDLLLGLGLTPPHV